MITTLLAAFLSVGQEFRSFIKIFLFVGALFSYIGTLSWLAVTAKFKFSKAIAFLMLVTLFAATIWATRYL